jgi:SAM-dependent methyltransferase
MSDAEVRTAYAGRAEGYATLLGSIDATHPLDRQLIVDWARPLNGPVIDAGCGPGHWTNFLVESWISAEGIDLVPEFIAHAQAAFPMASFRLGSLTDLGVPDGYAAGILAWYSLIHLEPSDVPAVLQELARSTAPGGGLLLGFFEGDSVQQFPHAVTAAYSWPISEVAGLLAAAGFTTLVSHSRQDPGHRPHAAIVARRDNTMGARSNLS